MVALITTLYTYPAIVENARLAFKRNGFIMFNDFFTKEEYAKVFSLLKRKRFEHIDEPAKCSFAEVESFPELEGMFKSDKFIDFLRGVSGKKKVEVDISVKRFTHKDFTLLHDDDESETGLKFFFIFADSWEENAGGKTIFMTKKEPLLFPVVGDCLAIVDVKKDMRDFVKYVNHFSRGSFYKVEGVVS